tara:strand:+ start:16274 stop:17290 length:1017 start_codon:yes stop_codon:yes gene_type:complete
MNVLRPFREFYIENGDEDLEGKLLGKINPTVVAESWKFFIRKFIDNPESKNIYAVDSSRKLIPPHRPEDFTLHKGLVLFHVSIHDPSIDFKYPQNEPFFSTTPSHGMAIAFQEKRVDVINKGYKARMMIFVLRRDLSAVDNCGDCHRLRPAESTVAGYNTNGDGVNANLNEIRLFKKTALEVEECVTYVTEYDLTSYILQNNGYSNYSFGDAHQLFSNREVIFNLPISAQYYLQSGWKPITSQMSPMSFMPFLLTNDEYKSLDRLFIFSLFALNQIWFLGDYDHEDPERDYDIALLILYNNIPKLNFLTDLLPGQKNKHPNEKASLRVEVQRIYPNLI